MQLFPGLPRVVGGTRHSDRKKSGGGGGEVSDQEWEVEREMGGGGGRKGEWGNGRYLNRMTANSQRLIKILDTRISLQGGINVQCE